MTFVEFGNGSPGTTFYETYSRKCTQALEIALRDVQAYRNWGAYDPGPSCALNERYRSLPILGKAHFIQTPAEAFVPAGRDVGKALASGEIAYVTTNGTSAERVVTLWYQPWWDATEKASWRSNLYTHRARLGDHREAILTSALSVGVVSDAEDLSYEARCNGRFLYLNEKSSPLFWQMHHLDRMVAELYRFRPIVLEANPSYLSRFARAILASGQPVFQPELIVLTYELASGLDYQAIRQVFHCPLCSSYGSTEAGHMFMECESGKFHQNTDSCRIDLEPVNPACTSPTIRRIIVTTFDNPWRALLRYDTGDLCRVSADAACPCGRKEGLVIDSLEGRASNLIRTVDGRLVTERDVDRVLMRLDWLTAYQLVQLSENSYLLRFTKKGNGMKDNISSLAADGLRELFGRLAGIQYSEEEIRPGASGKFRRVFPADETPVPERTGAAP